MTISFTRKFSITYRCAQSAICWQKGGAQAYGQDAINALIVQQAQPNRVVVRLKGGDPFCFGRGGEEARALKQAGISFRVMPGVTSGVAAPAYAGIPVTDRESAPSVCFMTGTEKPGNDRHDWQALALFLHFSDLYGCRPIPWD